MTFLLILLACTGEDDPDPGETCAAEGTAECCYDADCPETAMCWHTWTCVEKGGRRVCEVPTGDRTCHELCTVPSDTADPYNCVELTEECQPYLHGQGTNYTETVEACF